MEVVLSKLLTAFKSCPLILKVMKMLSADKQINFICNQFPVCRIHLRKKKEEMATDSAREKALNDYRKRLLEHKENEARLKESEYIFQ